VRGSRCQSRSQQGLVVPYHSRIVVDTDKANMPMARAFERAGYRRFLTRVAYAINLARLAAHP
jgi:hypothetical protein